MSQGKTPSIVRNEIISLFQQLHIQRGKAVFICQNPAFDRAFFIQIIDVYTQERLNWPYHWLDLASMYWALLSKLQSDNHRPFPDELCLSKNAIAHLYNIPEEARPHLLATHHLELHSPPMAQPLKIPHPTSLPKTVKQLTELVSCELRAMGSELWAGGTPPPCTPCKSGKPLLKPGS